MQRWLLLILSVTSACSLFSNPTPPTLPTPPPPTTTLTPPPPPAPTATPEPPQPSPTPTLEPTATTNTASGRQSFIAYVRDGQLLVTDVTGGVKGGTTQYTLPGTDDQVEGFAWSPSGEFIAYTSSIQGTPHIYIVYAVGAGTSTDIGPGYGPAWSSDGQSLVYFRDDNVWTTNLANYNAPTQLTFQQNWVWGNAIFTPDGSAVLVSGVAQIEISAVGNSQFYIYRVPLDSSGTLTPLPGLTEPLFGQLSSDLRFSPDGLRLAFTTAAHLSACASVGSYYVSAPDGSGLTGLSVPSLQGLLDPARDIVWRGFSFAWTPRSDALAMVGGVWDCSAFVSGGEPRYLAGPQLSIVGLDGVERLAIPGDFYWPTFDHTGQMLAAARLEQGGKSQVQIYALNGNLNLDLGEGTLPQFQP